MEKLAVNGSSLATVDQGRGPAVVLLHAFPLDHTMWNAQIEALSAHYRVIAPDLRGFGESEVSEGTVTIAQLADDVAGLLDALEIGEPAALFGLSMGGYVALEFWRRHPTRLRALGLCDTRAEADSAEVSAARLATADRVLREGPRFLAETMIPRLFCRVSERTAGGVEPAYIGATRELILATDPRGIAAAARGMAERSDFTPLLGEIHVPTLVLTGEHDAISTPAEMSQLAAAIAHSWFVEIAGAGHIASLENPVETTGAMSAFLASVKEAERATGS